MGLDRFYVLVAAHIKKDYRGHEGWPKRKANCPSGAGNEASSFAG